MKMSQAVVSLQKLWLKKPGTYHGSISFSNIDGPATFEGRSSFEVKSNGSFWDIGPLLISKTGEKWTSLDNISFTCQMSEVTSAMPVACQLNLYQELPDSSPSSSHSPEKKTHLELVGKGTLHLTSQCVLNSKQQYLGEEKDYIQRMAIKSNSYIGGLHFGLGSLILKLSRNEIPQAAPSKAESVAAAHFERIIEKPNHAESRAASVTEDPIEHRASSIKFYSPPVQSPKSVRSQPSLPNLLYEARDSFPAEDAVKQILPMFYQLVESPPKRRDSVKPYSQINEPPEHTVDSLVQHENLGTKDGLSDVADISRFSSENQNNKDLDKHVISVLEYQTKELDRYRQAVRKMAELVVELRNKISSLEMKNSQLRANMYYADKSPSSDFDSNSQEHPDSLRRHLITKTEEIEEQRLLLQKQQNELIMKNEYEKKYLKLLQAHKSQQALLQDYQAKISKYHRLEKTCKQQERIIRELEGNGSNDARKKPSVSDKAIDKMKAVSFQVDNSFSKDTSSLVPLQNGSQRTKMMTSQFSPNPNQSQRMFYEQMFDVEERMNLLQKLEKAEGRVMALEKQIMDNTRQWAREKSQNKFRVADGFPEFSGFDRRLPAPLTFTTNQIDADDPFYRNPNVQFRRHDSYGRFHHL